MMNNKQFDVQTPIDRVICRALPQRSEDCLVTVCPVDEGLNRNDSTKHTAQCRGFCCTGLYA